MKFGHGRILTMIFALFHWVLYRRHREWAEQPVRLRPTFSSIDLHIANMMLTSLNLESDIRQLWSLTFLAINRNQSFR